MIFTILLYILPSNTPSPLQPVRQEASQLLSENEQKMKELNRLVFPCVPNPKPTLSAYQLTQYIVLFTL